MTQNFPDWHHMDQQTIFTEIPGKNHFKMLEEREAPEGVVHRRIVSAIKQQDLYA